MLSEAKIDDGDISNAFVKKKRMIELKPIPRKGRMLSKYHQELNNYRHKNWKSQILAPFQN